MQNTAQWLDWTSFFSLIMQAKSLWDPKNTCTLHFETRSAYIYITKSHPLQLENHNNIVAKLFDWITLGVLPAGLDSYPVVGIDPYRGAQHHRLGAEVIGHLHTAVHDGEGDVVGTLHSLAAPQNQTMSSLSLDAQLKFIHQQGLLTRSKREEMLSQIQWCFRDAELITGCAWNPETYLLFNNNSDGIMCENVASIQSKTRRVLDKLMNRLSSCGSSWN